MSCSDTHLSEAMVASSAVHVDQISCNTLCYSFRSFFHTVQIDDVSNFREHRMITVDNLYGLHLICEVVATARVWGLLRDCGEVDGTRQFEKQVR